MTKTSLRTGVELSRDFARFRFVLDVPLGSRTKVFSELRTLAFLCDVEISHSQIGGDFIKKSFGIIVTGAETNVLQFNDKVKELVNV